MAPPKDIARSYPKRGLTADVGFRSEPKFCGDGSVYFDGSSDYAETAASSDLAVGDTFTLTAWVWLNPNPSGASKYAFRVGDTGAASPNIASISVFGGVTPQFYIYSGAGSVSSSVRCASARWYHVAAVIKPGSGTSQIFVDGIDTTNSHSLTFNVASSSSTIRIGDWNSGGNDWEGYIANACLFTESLTEDQVRQVMRASDYASHAAISTVEAFYPLSANFNDSTGSHNATLTGSVSFGVNRPQLPRGLDLARGAAMARVYTGRAVDFDGSADYLRNSATVPSITGAGAQASICAWVNFDSASGGIRNIASFCNTANDDGIVIYQNNAEIGVAVFNNAPTVREKALTSVSTSRWFFVVGTWDKDTASQKVYVDGVRGSGNMSVGIGIEAGTDIGARSSATPQYYFDGQIAGVKYFDVELTQAQIRELYHNPEQVLPTGVSASNLRRYYPLSDYNDTGGTGGRYFQDMGADGEPAEDKGSANMAFAQSVPCPQLGLQQSATRLYFPNTSTEYTLGTLSAAPGTAMSFSLWFNMQDIATNYLFRIGSPVASFGNSINLRLSSSGNSINMFLAGVYSSGLTANFGEWNHVVITTSSSSPYWRCWVNNVEASSPAALPSALNVTDTDIAIGSYTVGGLSAKGIINDVALWHTELDTSDVAALYNSGVQGMDVSTVQSANLKGWWKCDDLTTLKDYSGTGNSIAVNGTFAAASFPENASGSTIVGDFSMKRKGVSVLNPTATPLSGTGPRAQISNDGSLNPNPANGGFTASAFIRLEMQTASTTFLPTVFGNAVQPLSNKDWHLCIFAGNVTTTALKLQIGDGGTTYRNYSWPAVLSNPEQWHHIAYTIDFSTSPTTFRLYQDGALVSTQATYTHLAINTGDMNIGTYWAGNGNFPGAIACCKMYQTKLSDNEIEQIYRSDLRLIKGLANE